MRHDQRRRRDPLGRPPVPEVETLLGDPRKAREQLGWVPRTSFAQLVAEMMQTDLELAQRDSLVGEAGYAVSRHHE